MSQPARWLWGLIPLALLWGAANLARGPAIESDVGERAVRAVAGTAGVTPGARPIVAQVDGRDVTITGEVLSADGAGKAMAALRGEFGVRRALGGLSQVVAQKPYSWFAARTPGGVTLGGFAPDLETAQANAVAAGKLLPGLRIDDRQTIAFGAPEGFAAMTAAILAQLPKLASGRVALDDGRFCVEGTADSADSFVALEAAASQLVRPGFQSVSCDLDPPVVSPYRWRAERSEADTITLSGSFPRDGDRSQILAATRRAFPAGSSIRDEMKPGLGAPSAFIDKVSRALGDLARLRPGKAEIDGDVYTLSGKGPESYEACQALRLQIAQGDGPDSVARVTIECPAAPVKVEVPLPDIPGLILQDVQPAPATQPSPAASAIAAAPAQPLDWEAKRDEQGIVLRGAVPDGETRAGIVAVARHRFGAVLVEDRMTVAPIVAPALDLPASAAFALEALSNLKSGSVALRETALAIVGEAVDATAWQALRALLAKGGPAGLRLPEALASNIGVRPYGLVLSVDRAGLEFSGFLPDERTRETLAAQVADTPHKGQVSDRTQIAPGAPAGFADAARAVLSDLLRLDLGAASIEDDHVVLRGLTCRELVKSEVETHAASGLPRGFKVDAVIDLRQTGCVADPPASCQSDLDGLTTRNTILFRQGATDVELDPTTEQALAEAVGILGKCPGSAITIEGHANRDGDWRGFDNVELSLQRAMRVREELARRGVDPARLTVKAYGSARPVRPYDGPEARAVNRRVQFTVAK